MSEDKTPRNQMTTFDIESEYQQQIAPFEKKLVRLKKSFETKSLRLHKGFLTKEKKAQSKLGKIDLDAKKAQTKAESSTANKLAQLKKIDQNIKKSLKTKTKELKASAEDEKIVYYQEIDAIRDQLHDELENLHQDYLKNVHVYQEKLNSYKSQSDEKQSLYKQTFERHVAALSKEFTSVSTFTSNLQKSLLKANKAFLKDIKKSQNTTDKDKKDALSKAESTQQSISKKTNAYSKKIESFIDSVKASYVNHYQEMLKAIKEQEIYLKDTFSKQMDALKSDFRFRTKDEDTTIEQSSKTNEKNRKKRLALFEERYDLYKQIEDTFKDRKLALLSFEQTELREILNREMTNLDKLESFLKNDFQEINQYANHVHTLEQDVFSNIDKIHQALHSHLEASTKETIRFMDVFHSKVKTFEENLVSLIKTHLEQLHPLNLEIDRLDREIDLSEPEKEIALNDFEENLGLQEIKNRFQIKILNKEHELHMIDAKLAYDIALLSLEHDQKRLENDFEITSVKVKHESKLQLEDTKRKFQRAKEIYHLRENSLKHDEKQALLQVDTEIGKLQIKREKAPVEAEKSQLLSRKEIAVSMEQLRQKRDLESQMVSQKYSDQLKSIDHEIEQIDQRKQLVKADIKAQVQEVSNSYNDQVEVEKVQHQEQLDKLAEALERECKTPKSNIQKWEKYQEQRNQHLNQVLHSFKEANDEELSNYQTIEELEELLNIYDKETTITNTTNTIFGLYDVYLKTLDNLFTITKETLEDQLSLSIDTTAQRRLSRDLEKRIKDFEKQINTIKKARDQQVKTFVHSLSERLRRLEKQKYQSTSAFLSSLSHLQEETNTSLEHLNKELKKEVHALFVPLMEEDYKIIHSAEESQKQAKSKLEEDLQNQLRPIEVAYKKKQNELSKKEEKECKNLDIEIDALEEKKDFLDKTKQEEIRSLEEDYQAELSPYQEHLSSLDQASEKGEVQKIEEIDQRIAQFTKQETEIRQMYEEKLLEAKRILDFEEKIEETSKENIKTKEQEQLSRKRAIIDSELKELEALEKQAKIDLDTKEESLREDLYQQTNILGRENDLSNPDIQKEMQELRNNYEDKEVKNRQVLLETKKKVRHTIESFDQQMRTEYNQFFDDLNQHIEKRKTSFTTKVDKEVDEFVGLHQSIFGYLETSYREALKSMKANTLQLTQQLHRLNKDLS